MDLDEWGGKVHPVRLDASQVEQIEMLYGLPALRGSPAQIKWARQIRADLINYMIGCLLLKPEDFERKTYIKIAQSRFWIDLRNLTKREIDAEIQGVFK